MSRIAGAALVAILVPALAGAQKQQGGTTAEAKIREAMSAAPIAVSGDATIMDWPATPQGQPVVLKQGTNGWICMPTPPGTQGNAPMCYDDQWKEWGDAMVARRAPKITRIGFNYMMAPGGAYGSNTDPFATKATPTNEWAFDPPHIMILVPDMKSLEGLPTKRTGQGPWVMYAGTPYAHIMVPVAEGKP